MRIIVIGFGTVGRAFSKILHQTKINLLHRYGLRPRIVGIVDSGGAIIDSRGLNIDRTLTIKREQGSVSFDKDLGQSKMTALDVINQLDADVIVEVSPTNLTDGKPALSYIQSALKQQRHVITTNKGPLALAFPALMELAAYNKVFFRFSGTVGAGTPFLDLGKKILHSDNVSSIQGVLNGTTNYILTQMEAGKSFADALQEAQAAGYAESNPINDIEGLDTASKLVILANSVMNSRLTLKDVHIEGINQVSLTEVEAAKKIRKVIKLLAFFDKHKAIVQPQLLLKAHPLNVSGVLNAVTYTTKYSGEITLTGQGAGGQETASAILRDLINIRQSITE